MNELKNQEYLSFAVISIEVGKILLEVFAGSFGCDIFKIITHL
jgi:hypothetical protein